MDESKCLKNVSRETWVVCSVFVVENEAVCLADSMEGLCTVDLVGVDVVADEGEVFVEEASSVVLSEA